MARQFCMPFFLEVSEEFYSATVYFNITLSFSSNKRQYRNAKSRKKKVIKIKIVTLSKENNQIFFPNCPPLHWTSFFLILYPMFLCATLITKESEMNGADWECGCNWWDIVGLFLWSNISNEERVRGRVHCLLQRQLGPIAPGQRRSLTAEPTDLIPTAPFHIYTMFVNAAGQKIELHGGKPLLLSVHFSIGTKHNTRDAQYGKNHQINFLLSTLRLQFQNNLCQHCLSDARIR